MYRGHSRKNLLGIFKSKIFVDFSLLYCLRRRYEMKKPLTMSHISAPQKNKKIDPLVVESQIDVVGAPEATRPMLVMRMPTSESTFMPENVFTLSLFLSERDSSSFRVVKTEKIQTKVVSKLIFFIFLRKSMIEQTRKRKKRIDMIVSAVIFQNQKVYSMRLGVYTLTNLKGNYIY